MHQLGATQAAGALTHPPTGDSIIYISTQRLPRSEHCMSQWADQLDTIAIGIEEEELDHVGRRDGLALRIIYTHAMQTHRLLVSTHGENEVAHGYDCAQQYERAGRAGRAGSGCEA
eukprot:SAG22_NODE_2262_length_2775_cov_1.649103_2_plen_116_part_00